MYKVFINDKPIILTTSLQKKEGFETYTFKNAILDELLYKLKNNVCEGIFLYSTNIDDDWEHFCKNFKVITAAGGLVLNAKEEILFIFRGNKWDLPKGRIEKGESVEDTAIREVEEECGIFNLKITDFLLKTYHVFYQNNEQRLKETYWYLMHSNYKGKLKPQIEEGITEVSFKPQNEIEGLFENSYANIILVYNEYLKKGF